jgi:flagellar operon protein (TIGR03826 family)
MGNEATEICTCPRCGKIFSYLGMGMKLCQHCKDIDEEEFNKVKSFLYDNPLATVKETTLATGVKIKRIKTYIRDGRLTIPDSSPIFINCENCGTNIRFGRLCRECATSLSSELKKEMNIEEWQIGEKPQKIKDHFYFLEHPDRHK